jgi:uncharacterized protein
MIEGNEPRGWTAPLRGEQLKPVVILLVSIVAMVTWKYFADPAFLAERLPDEGLWGLGRGATAAIGSFAGAFVLLGLIPALVVKVVFRERLADYGVQLGIRKRTFRSMAIWIPFMVLGGYLSSCDPVIRAHYPINPAAADSPATFAIHAATYLLMYLGWEFHFRGFLQFGLRGTMGDASAVLVQVLASTLLHIGKPAVETYCAILGGILWGFFAFRTKSLLSGLSQHYLLGLSLDWFISCRGA